MGRKRTASEVSEPAVVIGGDIDGPGEPSAKRQQQRRSLFIRSLPESATTENLIELFSQSFPVKHATAVVDKQTQKCRGYGFVTFADAEDAQRAKEEFDGSMFQGKHIKLEIAEPRQRDQHAPGAETIEKSARSSRKQPAESKVKPTAEDKLPPKLIVRNLPWSIKTGEQLSAIFRSYGKINQAYIPSKKPGLLSGFGFVVIRGRKNAEKAIEGVNGKELDGRVLAVDWAVQKDVWAKQNNTVENEEVVQEDAEDDDSPSEVLGDGDMASEENDEDLDEIVDDNDAMDIGDNVEDSDLSEPEDAKQPRQQDYSTTLFIRNLPYTSTDELLQEQFSRFGGVRYARVVLDPETERPRGTGFVCFFSANDAGKCLKESPRSMTEPAVKGKKTKTNASKSILQSEEADPTGAFTMDGRVLQVSKAVERSEAARLTEMSAAKRNDRDKDKRRLYLLSEGTISADSPLHKLLSPSEIAMRDASLKQRKSLIQSNPSLHLSLTRLSIRNIPRSVDSKELKQLAREAVVGFAKDVKAGTRERLSREELHRGGDEMIDAERQRKLKGSGIVKQAKIVFEGREGSKVDEKTGGGRSRGYGFVEFHTHRAALMGLRWLNGHAIGPSSSSGGATPKKSTKKPPVNVSVDDTEDRKKRLIVEFAIENAQVVARRHDKEVKSRAAPSKNKKEPESVETETVVEEKDGKDAQELEKSRRRQQIINKKRAVRRARNKSKS